MTARTTRRTVAAFLALAGAAPAGVSAASTAIPMPAPDPDAALHAAVAEVRAARDALDLYNLDMDAPDTNEPGDRFDAAVDAVEAIAPRTLAGLAGKAQTVIAAMERAVENVTHTVWDEAEQHELVAYRFAHDVLAMAGLEPWPEHPARAALREQYAAARPIPAER